eukprot:79690_1
MSIPMSTLFTVGLILLCIGTMLFSFHPVNDGLCLARNNVYGFGAILAIGAPLLKSSRVAIIFAQARKLRQLSIPDKKLFWYLAVGVVIESIICIIYSILHQMNGGVEVIYHDHLLRMEYICNSSFQVTCIQLINYFYLFVLLLLLCFAEFQNRKSWKIFQESKCIFFGSYHSLLVVVVVVIFHQFVTDINIIITFHSSAIFISLCVIWFLFYGAKIYAFYRYPQTTFTSKTNANQTEAITKVITKRSSRYIYEQTSSLTIIPGEDLTDSEEYHTNENGDLTNVPLHHFTNGDIGAKITSWLENDINYNKHLLKTIEILSREKNEKEKLDGNKIVSMGIDTFRDLVQNDFLSFMSGETLDIIFKSFHENESITDKVRKQIQYFKGELKRDDLNEDIKQMLEVQLENTKININIG